MYNLPVSEDHENIYAQQEINGDLEIKTYYESLDIAGTNRVHYLKFSLPGELPAEKDEQLKERLYETQIKNGSEG
jgi:tRNA (guanine-N7-)-methyltransferase